MTGMDLAPGLKTQAAGRLPRDMAASFRVRLPFVTL